MNERLQRDLLTECYYSNYLLRLLHCIHVMRLKYPSMQIFILKLDLDAEYQQLHVTSGMAVLTITIIQKIVYILLRLPFGVANGPNDYIVISESIFYLTNDVLRDETYNPLELQSPLRT